MELATTDPVSVFEVLDPPGARLEFVLGDLELFPDLFRLVSDHGVGQLHLLVSALIQPLGELGLNLGEL